MSLAPLRRATPTDLVLLLSTVTMWAGAFVAIKLAVPSLGPLGVATARAVIGILVLAPFFFRADHLSSGAEPFAWGTLFVLAQLNITLPFVAISWAETRVDAGVAALLMGVGPLLAIVGAHLFLEDERINRQRLGGVMLGFLGVATLVGLSAVDGVAAGDHLAHAALLFASLCYVTAGLLVRRLDMPPLTLAISTLALAAVVLLPATAFVGLGDEPMDGTAWAAIIFLGVFPTGLAYLLRYYLIQRIGYTTFAVGINMIPVIGLLLGVALLGEELTGRSVLALCLILAGVAVARRATPEKAST